MVNVKCRAGKIKSRSVSGIQIRIRYEPLYTFDVKSHLSGTLQMLARSLSATRKELYEELHPETRRDASLKKGDQAPFRNDCETGRPNRFTADTASKTGRSERAVQQVALWIKLTEGELISSQVATKSKSETNPKGSGRHTEGINAASRVLGISKDDAHRAVSVASIPDPIARVLA